MRTREKYLTSYKTSEHLTHREKEELGSFWTPPEIAIQIAKAAGHPKGELVLDPNCGGGALLAAMMDAYPFLQEEDLYGIDIDPKAIEICIRLFPHGHFQVGNSLTDPITDDAYWNKPPFELWNENRRESPVLPKDTPKERERPVLSADIIRKANMLKENRRRRLWLSADTMKKVDAIRERIKLREMKTGA